MPDPRFPGAPPGSYVTEEGWLVYGDEAWTEDDWRVYVSARPAASGHRGGPPRRYETVSERRHFEYIRRRAKALGVSPDEILVRRMVR